MTLARLSLARLARSSEAWLASIGWAVVVFTSAWLKHKHDGVHGVDRALDVYSEVALPLLVYALVGVSVTNENLARSGRPLVALGASRSRVALSTILVSMTACAILGGALGAGTVAVSHDSGDVPMATDAFHTFGFGGLGGAVYAAYFMLGASLVGGIWGRGLFLVLDWILGSDEGLGALLTPRGNLRNLLGGEAPFDALPWQSLVMLTTLGILFTAIAVVRASRARD